MSYVPVVPAYPSASPCNTGPLPDVVFHMILELMLAAQLGASAAAGGDPGPSLIDAAAARTVVERSLPFIEKEGVTWMEERKCASCHQIPSMLWSLNNAARAGLKVDRTKVDEWTQWSLDWRRWTTAGAKNKEDKAVADNVDTMVFLMLGRYDTAKSDEAWMGSFRDRLLINQLPDGSWKPGGQMPLLKRPERERKEVTTMWTVLALKSSGAGLPPVIEAEKRALGFLATAQPGKSTEWLALQVLIKRERGENCDAVLEALLKTQNSDGGWAWLGGEASDAFGTGLALHATARAGTPISHASVQRACDFLKRTQQADGSWAVPSTRAQDKNKVRATSTYWGTAWAVIGMLEFFPEARTASVR